MLLLHFVSPPGRARLAAALSITVIGCTGASIEPDVSGDKRNGFCEDDKYNIEFTGEYSAWTEPSYPGGRSELNLEWGPPEAGTWRFTVRADDIAEQAWVTTTLARPRCDADLNLTDDAFDPLVERDARSSAFLLENTDLRRIWVDVFDESHPEGTFITLSATRLDEPTSGDPSAAEDPCASFEGSCVDCTYRAGCGWCNGRCTSGDSVGPAFSLGSEEETRECTLAWTWLPGECPPPPPAW